MFGLPQGTKESLLFYKATGYGEINDILRQGSIPTDTSKMSTDQLRDQTVMHIINIDQAITKGASKPQPTKLFYRGVHGLDYFIETQGILVNKAYSSCSSDINQSFKFSGDECCIIVFTIPNDINYFEYKSLGINDYEQEILIQRNTQFVEFKPITSSYNGVQIYNCVLKRMPSA